MTTKTEDYIKKAVEEAKKELSNNITNCVFNMKMEADGATETLAEAMLAQAQANKANSEAMAKLAASLKPIDACAVRITEGKIQEFGE